MQTSTVRRRVSVAILSLILSVGGCGGTPVDEGEEGDGNTVTVGNNFFSPETLQVTSGATVTWNWAGGITHNVTFASGAITSSGARYDGSFQTAMPTTAGSYRYQCTFHPTQMNGSVTVQ